MGHHPDSAHHQVLVRAFRIASATGERARPVHLLAALSATGGPISEALTPLGDVPLFGDVDDSADRGGGSSYLLAQTQQAAHRLASGRGETPGPEHLLLAVLEQAEPEAMALLHHAGLEPSALRVGALRLLGAPADLPPIPMPALAPAGTMDRPALLVDELDPAAWDALFWRQEHLPLRRLRNVAATARSATSSPGPARSSPPSVGSTTTSDTPSPGTTSTGSSSSSPRPTPSSSATGRLGPPRRPPAFRSRGW